MIADHVGISEDACFTDGGYRFHAEWPGVRVLRLTSHPPCGARTLRTLLALSVGSSGSPWFGRTAFGDKQVLLTHAPCGRGGPWLEPGTVQLESRDRLYFDCREVRGMEPLVCYTPARVDASTRRLGAWTILCWYVFSLFKFDASSAAAELTSLYTAVSPSSPLPPVACRTRSSIS